MIEIQIWHLISLIMFFMSSIIGYQFKRVDTLNKENKSMVTEMSVIKTTISSHIDEIEIHKIVDVKLAVQKEDLRERLSDALVKMENVEELIQEFIIAHKTGN